MTDAASGAAQAAQEALEELQNEVTNELQEQQAPEVQFSEVLGNLTPTEVGPTNEVPGASEIGQETDLGSIIRRAREEVRNNPRIPSIEQAVDSRPLWSGLQRVMEDVFQGQNKLDEIINLSMTGRNFSTPELIALQAAVYRFTQELELMSKVVDKGTGTIKQVMNTQV